MIAFLSTWPGALVGIATVVSIAAVIITAIRHDW